MPIYILHMNLLASTMLQECCMQTTMTPPVILTVMMSQPNCISQVGCMGTTWKLTTTTISKYIYVNTHVMCVHACDISTCYNKNSIFLTVYTHVYTHTGRSIYKSMKSDLAKSNHPISPLKTITPSKSENVENQSFQGHNTLPK